MKKSLLVAAMMSVPVFASAQTAELYIEGVFDGPLTGGTPKAVEIFVGQSGSLNGCGIGSANNGGGSDGEEFSFPDVMVSGGQHIYITVDNVDFNTYFGFDADYESGAVSINGDDAIELYCGSVVIDVYGDVDGTDQGTWNYQDGWAHRNSLTSPQFGGTVPFDANQWQFSGANAVDGCTTNASCVSQYPFATLPVELMNFSID